MNLEDEVVGGKFNNWTVIGVAPRDKTGKMMYRCQCECGTERDVRAYSLFTGDSKSCGCKVVHNTRHGMCNTKLYWSWQTLRLRCDNPRHPKYKNYGGRGITYDKKWEIFMGFMEDMYESYQKHFEKYGRLNTSLDRIDVNGNYCKENCRWATQKEQARNKQKHVYVTVFGESMQAKEVSEKYKIPYPTIMSRVYAGKYDMSDLAGKYD